MITHDFLDGKGPAPAHQHPNGKGWVADTATVADTAYIGPDAKVFGKAWVYDNAQINNYALVCGNAQVYGNAKVYDFAWVYGNAKVYGDARVYGNAKVYGKAKVYGYAQVYNYARVFGKAKVYGNAQVYGVTWVYDNAQVYGESVVYNNAQVYKNAHIYGKAIVSQRQHAKYGNITTNLADDILASIKVQTNLDIIDGKIICYKKINANLSSIHDSKFKYKVGKIAEAKNPNLDPTESCAAGLHFSNKDYNWDGPVTLECSVDIEDIISVQEGKIRVKKAMVLGIV